MNPELSKKICTQCGAKCCYFGGPSVTEVEKEKVLHAGHPNYFIPSPILAGYFNVKDDKGECPYLKDNLCSIHDVRPLVCRTWPVESAWKGNEHKIILLDCPLAPHLNASDLKTMKKQAMSVPKELYDANNIGLSKNIQKRLNEFGWDKKIKEATQ